MNEAESDTGHLDDMGKGQTQTHGHAQGHAHGHAHGHRHRQSSGICSLFSITGLKMCLKGIVKTENFTFGLR